MPRPSRIVLAGFSATGKSAVAPIVAARLNWRWIDTDELVEKRAGKSILDIFRDEGEEHFRDLESVVLRELGGQTDVVIATGGGVVLRPENRRMLAEGGFIVCLDARPETIFRRLADRAGHEPLDRPLLSTADPLSRIRELKQGREHIYALCDWTVHTEDRTYEQVADEVMRAWEMYGERALADPRRVEEIGSPRAIAPRMTLHAIPAGADVMVTTASAQYPVYAKWGRLPELGTKLVELGLGRQTYVITDEAVAHHYEDEISEALKAAAVPFDIFAVPPGETSKTLRTASELYDWLLQHKAERGHTIIGFGGGVVTDLAGYVAATFARGLPLVHVPTSLLGMVDAAIGGKVAVNHARAKNLIGAFYQPRMVLADIALLRTLPPREIHSGWAEAIKHALIADEGYLRFLEDGAEGILKLDADPTVDAVRRSIAIKAAIVAEDEREETGRRTVLNYGHTVAHALEATTGYSRFRHGEADGIGMTAAAFISERLGLLRPEIGERQRRLLERFKLPTTANGLDPAAVKAATALDKKVQGRSIRWVLLAGIGKPVLRDDVPENVVDSALDHVLR
ncbi:MAG: 3-dehydroquinate synthase [Chloroflexi bacterium]|nr:MAG: 3-dehydroquinate synthase [Chloroflexota bacterium]